MKETPHDRLRRAREARGFRSAREAALHYGWAVPTYTSHENGTRGLRVDAAEKYAKALGVPVDELLQLTKSYPVHAQIQTLRVLGVVQVGVWVDTTVAQSLHETVTPPDVGLPMSFALRVEDRSVDRVIAQGELAICAAIPSDEQLLVMPGTLVVVERRKGSIVERTIRRVASRNGDHVRCVFASTDTKLQSVISAPSETADETVTIVARVVGKFATLD